MSSVLQGYLAHEKEPPPLGPPYDPSGRREGVCVCVCVPFLFLVLGLGLWRNEGSGP